VKDLCHHDATDKRFLGIFVNPLFAQSEGVQQVLDNIESVGATAICFDPFVSSLAEGGKRVPDLHLDGHTRSLGRPVWGKKIIHIESYLAYEPNPDLYQASPYKPITKPMPPGVNREIVNHLVAEAKKRGMRVHVLFSPLFPPNIRREDQPVRIDGSIPQPPQVALSACPNSPAVESYGLALTQDLLEQYPDLDGLIPDWLEYGAYCLEDHFTCFCPHCERKAREQGLDWDGIRDDVASLWNWLHSLTPRELERSRRLMHNPSELLEILTRHPRWLDFLRFKAESVVGFYRKIRDIMNTIGLEKVELSARGWPPPWNRSTGMDYGLLTQVCDAVAPKLFTFDYSALPRWYGQSLLEWNPGLSESEVLDALVEWLNLPDDFEVRSFSNYHIPAPDEPHPAKIEAYQTRLDEVADQVRGRAHYYPIAHAYMPRPQWEQMIALIRDGRADGMWVNMYGYLSDEKLEILRQTWR